MSSAESAERGVEDLCRELGPGAALPGERELAQEYGVSRMTLRRALEHLVARRVIERRHGAGTFVRRPSAAQPLLATSFREDMRRRGFVPSTRLIDWDAVVADRALAARLEMSGGDPVLRVRRLRLADGEPMGLELLHVPAALVPGLRGEDLDGDASFYEVLGKRFHRHISSGRQTVEPIVLEPTDAGLLAVAPGRPALRFTRVSRDDRGDVIELVHGLYRGDRYLIEIDLLPPRRPS